MKLFSLKLIGTLTVAIELVSMPHASFLWGQDWENPTGVCMDCGNDVPSTNNGSSYSYSGPTAAEREAAEAARQERNRQYDAVHQPATEAFERGDYQEALRLYELQKKLRDGPNVRLAIKQTNAYITWHAAKTSEDLRWAVKMSPSSFSAENLKYIDGIEAKEKEERERPRREAEEKKRREKKEAEDVKAASKVRDRLSNFAKKMQAPVSSGADTKEGKLAPDAFGGKKASPALEFGEPGSMENASEQMRQGFDNAKPMVGATIKILPNGNAEAIAGDPRMIEATHEMKKLRAESDGLDAEIERLTKKRNAAKDASQMKMVSTELDEKNKAKQENLVEISKTTEKTAKLRRSINTEVETKMEKSK